MKKKYLTLGKKTLALVMTCLMVMTCWVFFAPTEAEAATAGSYYVEIHFQCDSVKVTNSSSWDSRNVVIKGKSNNGTGTSSEIYNNNYAFTDTGDITIDTFTSSSFPTSLTFSYSLGGGMTNLNCKGTFYLKVGTSSSNAQKITLSDASLDISSGWFSAASGTVNATVPSSAYPKANSISWTNTAKSITVPTTGTATASTASATTYDQYGAEWYQEPNYALSSSSTATTTSETITGVSRTTDRADTCTVSVTNSAKDWVLGTDKKSSRDVYITAYDGSVKTSTTTKFTITNYKVDVTFNNFNHSDDLDNTASGSSSQSIYYGFDATAPTLTNGTNYTVDGWYGSADGTSKISTTDVKTDTNFYAKWTPVNYNVTYSPATKADGTKNEDTVTAYPYGTPASTVEAGKPANTANDYDGNNHYSYKWPTFNVVENDITYNEQITSVGHSVDYKDKTATHHTAYCVGKHADSTACTWSDTVEHTIGRISTITSPGCDSATGALVPGVLEYECEVCLHTWQVSGVAKDAEGNIVEAPGHHTWGSLVNRGDGTHARKCSICSAYDTAEEHNGSILNPNTDVYTKATCTTPGFGKYTCSCGYSWDAEIPVAPDAHDIHAISDNNGKHSAQCTREGCGYSEAAVNCVDSDSNCVCDDCGYNIPHVYGKNVVAGNLVSLANCQNYAVYKKSCNVCGDVSEDTFEDEAAGYGDHNWTSDRKYEFSPATCEDDAVYYYSCVYCGISCEGITNDTWSDMDTAKGHKATGSLVPSDDTHHGYKCERFDDCGTYLNEAECTYTTYTDNGDGTHTASCDDACGHTHTDTHDMSDWKSDDENGTVAGTQSRECTVCDYKETQVICNYEEKAHVDSTCSTKGYTTYECKDCGHGYTVVHDVDSKNHSNYGTKDVTVIAATCNAVGEYKKVCKGCGADIETGLVLAIDPTNHGTNTTTTTGDGEATCVTEGWSGEVTCDGCSAVIKANTSLGKDPNKHKNTTDVSKKDSTCTQPGYEAYDHCEDCNADIGYTVIEPKGHNYDYENKVAVQLDGDVHAYQCERYAECSTTGVGDKDGTGETEDCSGGEATCTALAVCTICNDTHGTYADHVFNGAYKQYVVDGEEYHNRKCAACDAYGIGTGRETDGKTKCSGGEATCTDKAVCSACNNEYGAALGHDFTPADSRINSLGNGYHNYKCVRNSACGAVGTVADGVDGKIACYDAEPKVTNPTCTTGGYKTHTCDTCGYDWTTDQVGALGHDYTEVKVDSNHLKDGATCETAATYWYDCSRCDSNAKNDENATDKFFSSGSPKGHTFDRNEPAEEYLKTPANCTENAIYYVSCSVCFKSSALVQGQEKTFAKASSYLGHDWIDYVDESDATRFLKEAANCSSAAIYYKSCSRCKISSREVSSQTATFLYGEPNNHVFTEKLTDSAHRISVATCVASASYYYDCQNCTVNAKNLSAADVEKYSAIGSLTYNYGSLGTHPTESLENVGYLAPTCESGGHSAYQHCTLCNADIGKIDADVDPAYGPKGHNFKGSYKYNADTDMHQRACLNKCGKYGEEEACVFGGWTQSKNAEDKEIHTKNCVCGNTESALCSGGEATCLKKAVCTTCNKEYGSAKGHNYSSEWVKVEGKDLHKKVCSNGCEIDITEACTGGTATCSELAECTVCKEKYGKYTGHTFLTYEKSEEAKCGVNAKETAICEYCTAKDTREIEGSALTHQMSDYTYAKQEDKPTCQSEGIETSTCTRGCGHTLTRPVPADKNAHVWTEWTEIGGDCSSGIVKQRECTVCGDKEKYTDTENLQHDWVNKVIVQPGCETDGYAQQECSKCHFTQTITEGYEAIGHSYTGEYTFYKAATCTTPEIWSRPCDNSCGKLELIEKEGTMLEHNWVIWAGTNPTCTMDGYTDLYHCVDCGFEKGGEALPALSHDDADGDGRCDDCNGVMNGEGTDACTCICHKENAFMKFIFKIVNFFWKLFKIGKSCDCGNIHWE